MYSMPVCWTDELLSLTGKRIFLNTRRWGKPQHRVRCGQARQYPGHFLLGPRQTGKTTLLGSLKSDPSLSLVSPSVRQRYESVLAGETGKPIGSGYSLPTGPHRLLTSGATAHVQ